MNNITKIQGGFEMSGKAYQFEQFTTIGDDPKVVWFQQMSTEQILSGTTNGLILLDLTMTIDGTTFDDITNFSNYLYEGFA
jgi:hypothetical protein